MNKNVPLLNRTHAEQNFAALVLTLMALSVSNHNGMLLADHFMVPQSIPRDFYLTNQFLI